MQTPNVTQCLRRPVGFLSSLTERASVAQLRAMLEETPLTLADVRDWVEFDDQQYRRNLVVRGPWFEILLLCWRSGQRSPIHDHAASTCGFKILQGICSETTFARSRCGQVVARSTVELPAGSIGASQDDDTHQVSNLEPRGIDLVTMHVYSPPLRSMKRFSITDPQVEEWRPPVFDFVGGDGI
jgi:cysteine dioxygenase